jgi:hypothetical protein
MLMALLATAPAMSVALIAADWWQPAVLILLLGVLMVASVQNVRLAIVIGVAMATFTDYGLGGLIYKMMVIVAWLLWSGYILFLRSSWVGWKFPPRHIMVVSLG